MSEREFGIPSTISDKAKQVFRDATPEGPWEMTSAGVEKIRDEGHSEVATINEQIIEKYVERLEDTELSGVRVQMLTPRGYQDRSDDPSP